MKWIQRVCPNGMEPGHRQVFGVIREARVIEPQISAYFVIDCSDGTVIQQEFPYTLNPCAAVGGLVRLELSPDNQVHARRFKAYDDMLEADGARRKPEQSRNSVRDQFPSSSKRDSFRKAVDAQDHVGYGFTFNCEFGTAVLMLDVGSEEVDRLLNTKPRAGFSELHKRGPSALSLVRQKVTLTLSRSKTFNRPLRVRIGSKDIAELLNNKWPSKNNWDLLVKYVRAKKQGHNSNTLPPATDNGDAA